jgi:hypothetical protein
MTDPPPPERKLTGTQVDAVLARALELQSAHAEGATQTDVDATSIQQLSDAAAEVGLSPDLVRRAATEILDSPSLGLSDLIEIQADSLVIDRIFPGSFSPDDVPHLLDDLREIVGAKGEWHANSDEFSWGASGMRLRIASVGRNSRVDIRTPFAPNGFPVVGCVTVWGSLFALVLILLTGGDPFSGLALLFLAIFAGVLGTAVHLVTRQAFARARNMRLHEAKQALAAVTSRLRA